MWSGWEWVWTISEISLTFRSVAHKYSKTACSEEATPLSIRQTPFVP